MTTCCFTAAYGLEYFLAGGSCLAASKDSKKLQVQSEFKGPLCDICSDLLAEIEYDK